jgi:uncharacterized protein (TIGR02678 family)
MTDGLLHELEIERRDEQQRALRGLLRRPLIGSREDPAVFALIRRHESALRARVLDLLGYRLAVHADHARLYRPSWRREETRPATIPRKREATDRWAPFTRRHYLLLFLALAVLEDRHSRMQMTLSELAEEIAQLGRELGIETSFDARGERLLLSDVIEWLCYWHVVEVSEGERSRDFVDQNAAGDCLLTVDHGRLGSLISSRRALTEIDSSDDLLSDGDYPPSDEGRRARIRHRLARRLVEDPVVYIDEIDEEERQYFVAQRPTNLSAAIEQATGMRPEHRAEGTAFIDPERELSDFRFPDRAFDRQLPLLLCSFLAWRLEIDQPEISRPELRTRTRELIEQHKKYWPADANDGDHVEDALNRAETTLTHMRLVEPTNDGVRALAAAARYRDPVIRRGKEQAA